MPIVIRTDSTSQTVTHSPFENENQLENLLAGSPELLQDDGGSDIELVARQVDLRGTGRLDLLFVTGEGLPIVVEVKLAANPESRREVLAQAIDYLSSLTALTVDELDEKVGNSLEKALRKLTGDAEFDKIWTAVGTNLRAGRARVVVALDEAPLGLERVFRYLARYSDLDIQLLTVQRYFTPNLGEVFVPQLLVDQASEDKPNMAVSYKSIEERLAACQNVAVVEFFRVRSQQPTSSRKDALIYRQAGMLRWYVSPRETNALVTQIGRFENDETKWRDGLAKANIAYARNGANLRFELTTSADLSFFQQFMDGAATLTWVKPQAKMRSSQGLKTDD
jgi:hypothetical protein